MTVKIARTVADLRTAVTVWRQCGHARRPRAHHGRAPRGASLAHEARTLEEADRVIVSIFVNPTQFAPTEDLAAYPRTFEADLAAISQVGEALVFAPDAKAMYPAGFATTVSLAGPAAVGLEDRFRPTHFAGVATVVAKLFLQATADVALFGEKDYQQLMVVTRMARDLDLTTRVIGCPTIREEDGLAMSSRNRFLSAEERATAAAVPRSLAEAASANP